MIGGCRPFHCLDVDLDGAQARVKVGGIYLILGSQYGSAA